MWNRSLPDHGGEFIPALILRRQRGPAVHRHPGEQREPARQTCHPNDRLAGQCPHDDFSRLAQRSHGGQKHAKFRTYLVEGAPTRSASCRSHTLQTTIITGFSISALKAPISSAPSAPSTAR